MTTKHDVIRVHREHPEWAAHQIAAHLGCLSGYVRKVAAREGLDLPKGFGISAGPTIEQLGRAARSAGLTVADIEKIANARRVHALAAGSEA